MFHTINPVARIQPVAEYTKGESFRVENKPNYAFNLADALGIPQMRVDMRKATPIILALQLWTNGLDIDGTTWSIITGSSAAKGKRFTAFPMAAIGKWDFPWFGPANITRLGALLTPLTGWGTQPVTVKFVDKRDQSYGNADGQGVVSERFAIARGNDHFDQDQLRLVFPDLKAMGKLTSIVNPRLDDEGIDLVLDATTLKAEILPEVGAVWCNYDFTYGVVDTFTGSSPADVGYQVIQAMHPSVQAAIDKALPNMVRELTIAMTDPNTFVKASAELMADPGERDALEIFSNLCLELSDNRLMYSTMMAVLIEEVMSRIGIAMAVSGNTHGKLLASRSVPGLAEGQAVVSPSSGIPEGEALVFRNPFVHAGAAFTVEIRHDDFVELDGGWLSPTGRGSIGLGDMTGLASARDNDGDKLVIIPKKGMKPFQIAMLDYVRTVQVKRPDKGHMEGDDKPATYAEALFRFTQQNPGGPANAITRLIIAKTKNPEVAPEAKKHFLRMINVLQETVDTKHWPTVHWDLVQMAREFVKPYVTERDFNFTFFSNGRILPWTHCRMEQKMIRARFPDSIFSDPQTGLRYGKIIEPADFVSSNTPIGARFCLEDERFEDVDWPVRAWSTIPNGNFADWIKVRPGKEYDKWVDFHKFTVEGLRTAHELPEEEMKRMVSDVLQNYSDAAAMRRPGNLETMTREERNQVLDETEQIVSAMWHCCFDSERSEGRLLLRAMKALGYEWFLGLIRRDWQPGAQVFEGVAYGAAPEKFLQGEHMVKVAQGLDSNNQQVQKMFFSRRPDAAYLMVKPGKAIPEGIWNAKLTRMQRKNGGNAQRAAFVLTPVDEATLKALGE